MRQPATDHVAPAQRVRFAAAHLGEQHVGDGLAADAGVEEERPAGRGVQPFAERLVEEFLSVRGVGHEAAEPVAAGEELLLVPLQDGRGEILGERAGGGEEQAQQRLGGGFIVLAKAQHETVVVAPVQSGQAGFELAQLRHGQRAFAQAFLDDLEIEDHPFAALDQQVLGFGLLRRRQGGQRGVRREMGAVPRDEVGAVARVGGVQHEGFEALQPVDHVRLGAAGHHEADPVREAVQFQPDQLGDAVVAIAVAALVKRVDDDHQLVFAPDQPVQRFSQQEAEEVLGVPGAELAPDFVAILLGGVRTELELPHQTHAVVFPALGELEGERAQGVAGIAQFVALGVDEPAGDDGAALAAGQVGGDRRLADAGAGLDPEDAGSGIVEPLPVGVKDPVAADEVGHMLGDLRLEAGGSQGVAQRTGLVGERGGFAFEALDQVDELLLVPALPFDAGYLAVADGAPLAEVGPLQVLRMVTGIVRSMPASRSTG